MGMIFEIIALYISLLISQITGKILDMILQTNIAKEQIMQEIYILLFWSAIIILPNLIKRLFYYAVGRTSDMKLRREIYKKLQYVKEDYYETTEKGKFLAYLTKEIPMIKKFLGEFFQNITHLVMVPVLVIVISGKDLDIRLSIMLVAILSVTLIIILKLYKKKNLCEKLLSLDISDLDKSIKKMKLPEYVINIIEKITKCDYKIRFINNYIIPYVEKREKFTFIKTKLPIFVTLGNHEISNFDTLSQAYNYYKSLYDSLGIKLLHNNSYENDDYIIFGGIGFAKYNERYNADSLCGPRLFSRKEEIKESDLFFKEYKNRLDNAINQKKKLIVVSHYPVRDWSLNYVTDLHCSYFTGHTHQNQNLLQKNIYADNQIGYYNNCFKMKSVNLGVASNPFFDYKDGYHVITTEDYAKFYNYSKERIQGTRLIENQIKNYGEKFYMIKHKGKYVFFLISHINTKICIGGKIKTISNCSDIEHFDKIFDKMVNKYIELFAPYWKYINQMASEVKSLGYCGDVHGCIVDLDFCNHIMINPLDQKVTFYNSPTMGFVKIFDNLENLITYMNNGYILNIEKKKMLELKKNNAIISKTSQEISQEVGELIKIDIKNSVYSISNYMRQIQRLFDSNILRDWNEDIISIQKR